MSPPPAHGFRTFVFLWASQSLVVLASFVIYFASTIWLAESRFPSPAERPELAFALAATAVAFMLPLLLAPVAGAWADRHDRRTTMVVMDLASALTACAMGALLLSGRLQLGAVLVLVALNGTFSLFHQQTLFAGYFVLVSDTQRTRANGMMLSTVGVADILAPAVAAVLMGLVRGGDAGAAAAVAICAGTFLVGGLTVLFLNIPSPPRGERDRRGFWQDVGFGATYIWRRQSLLWLLGLLAAGNFVLGFQNIFLPLIVKLDLAGDWARHGMTFRSAYALVTAIASIGGVVGGLAISAWGGLRRRRLLGVLVPLVVGEAAQVVFGFSRLLDLSAAMLAVFFLMEPVLNAHSQTIWQGEVPAAMQGRVFAMRRLIAQGSGLLSAVFAGWAGAMFDPGLVLAGLGAVYLLFCIGQFFNRRLFRVEDHESLEHSAATAGSGA